MSTGSVYDVFNLKFILFASDRQSLQMEIQSKSDNIPTKVNFIWAIFNIKKMSCDKLLRKLKIHH